MKNMKKITTLLLALLTVLMMSQAVLAETSSADGGTFVFNGSAISNPRASSDIDSTLSNLEPGDEISIVYNYENRDNEGLTTDWYLSNEILDTLEEASAEGGGYSYKLINHPSTGGAVTLFDSDAVGGQDTSVEEGLLQVNKAITGESEEEFFHIDTVEVDDGGYTEIVVGINGEAEANAFELKTAALGVTYAVEKQDAEGTTIYKRVKTGDDNNLLTPVLTLVAALLLLILAIISIKRDRKDGEEA